MNESIFKGFLSTTPSTNLNDIEMDLTVQAFKFKHFDAHDIARCVSKLEGHQRRASADLLAVRP